MIILIEISNKDAVKLIGIFMCYMYEVALRKNRSIKFINDLIAKTSGTLYNYCNLCYDQFNLMRIIILVGASGRTKGLRIFV